MISFICWAVSGIFFYLGNQPHDNVTVPVFQFLVSLGLAVLGLHLWRKAREASGTEDRGG